MQISNPYGAVPNALKDTRLTLRDIGQDIVSAQNAENQMSLAVSEQDIRRAKTMSDIEGDKQRRAETAARLYGQNLQNQQLAQTIKEQNSVVTAEQFAGRIPGGKHLLPLFGIDPAEKRTVAEWTPIGQQLGAIMQKSPYIAFQATQFSLKGEIDELNEKVAQKGLDETTKGKLIQQRDQKLGQYIQSDKMGNAITVPDKNDLIQQWGKTAALQATYPTVEEYVDAALKLHSSISDDRKKIEKAAATAGIDPNYTQNMSGWQQVIATKLDKTAADKILKEVETLASRGDLQGAHSLARSWAQKFGAPASTPTTSGAPETPFQTPQATAPVATAPVPANIHDMPNPNVERVKKVGSAVGNVITSLSNATGGRVVDIYHESVREQTRKARKEINMLREEDQLNPDTLQEVKKKYPRANYKEIK